MPKEFRADIQALRAYAVLAVLIFHLGLPLRGGFLGVDLFFVVSGFVISQRILGEIEHTGCFSLRKFFERRAFRLIPTLLLTTQLTLVASWLFLSPFGVQDMVRKTAIAGSLLSPNLYIARGQTDYFGFAASQNPLLHLWSLGVEDQFYIMLALIVGAGLIWIGRERFILYFFGLTLAMMSCGFVALALNSLQPTSTNILLSYYSPLPRLFELGAGVLAAIAVNNRKPISHILQLACQFLGLFILALCFILIPGNRMPNLFVVFVVSGVVLVIFGSNVKSKVSNLVLRSRVIRIVGDSSYSIYLVHLPILVILEYNLPRRTFLYILGALGAILLGVVFRYFVELPFVRAGYNRKLISRFLIIASLGSLLFNLTLATAVTTRISEAWQTESGTLRHGDTGQEPFYNYLIGKFIPCDLPELKESFLAFEGVVRCFQSKPGKDFDVAIVGDSHAEAYFAGIAQNLPDQNVLYLITAPSPHISDGRKMKLIYDWLSIRKDIRFVLLNGFWQRKVLTEKVLSEDLQALRAPNRHIILTSDVPDFPFDATNCKYRLSVINNSSICRTQDIDEEFKNVENDHQLNQAASRFSLIEFVDTYGQFCSGKTCQMDLNGDLLFRDTDHLNVLGSKFIGRFIVKNSSLAELSNANFDVKNSVGR